MKCVSPIHAGRDLCNLIVVQSFAFKCFHNFINFGVCALQLLQLANQTFAAV